MSICVCLLVPKDLSIRCTDIVHLNNEAYQREAFKLFRDKYHYPSQDEFALEKTPLPLNINIFYFFIYNLKWEVATYSHFHLKFP